MFLSYSRQIARSLSVTVLILNPFGCSAVRMTEEPQHGTKEKLFNLCEYQSVQDRHGQDPNFVVVVAISGGGYRAANFGLGALLGLENVALRDTNGRETTLLNEVDYVSTVSGGGMPGAILTRYHLTKPVGTANFAHSGEFRDYVEHEDVKSALRRDLEKQLGVKLLNPKVLFTPVTRGDEVQREVDETFLTLPQDLAKSCIAARGESLDGKSISLGAVFPRRQNPRAVPCAPYWIANSTIYNNGRTLSFTPDALRTLGLVEYWHGNSFSIDGDASSSYDNIPLALGFRSSFNFPAVFPPTEISIRSRDTRAKSQKESVYLLDGGLADNLGLYPAMEILRFEYERSRRYDCTGSRGPALNQKRLLVVIDAFNGSSSPEGETSTPKALNVLRDSLDYLGLAAGRSRAFADLTSPDTSTFSLVEAVSREADAAVVYLSLDNELVARKVGTRLSIDITGQNALISAGENQVCEMLGGSRCPNPSNEPRGIVLFARSETERLRKSLVESARARIGEVGETVTRFRNGYEEEVHQAMARGQTRNLKRAIRKLDRKVANAGVVKENDVAPLLSQIDQTVESAKNESAKLRTRHSDITSSSGASMEESIAQAIESLDVVTAQLTQARGEVASAIGKSAERDAGKLYSNSIRVALAELEALYEEVSDDESRDMVDGIRASLKLENLTECTNLTASALSRVTDAVANSPERAHLNKSLEIFDAPDAVSRFLQRFVDESISPLDARATEVAAWRIPADKDAADRECVKLSETLQHETASMQSTLELLQRATEADLAQLKGAISPRDLEKLRDLTNSWAKEIATSQQALLSSLREQLTRWPDVLNRRSISTKEWADKSLESSDARCQERGNAMAGAGLKSHGWVE